MGNKSERNLVCMAAEWLHAQHYIIFWTRCLKRCVGILYVYGWCDSDHCISLIIISSKHVTLWTELSIKYWADNRNQHGQLKFKCFIFQVVRVMCFWLSNSSMSRDMEIKKLKYYDIIFLLFPTHICCALVQYALNVECYLDAEPPEDPCGCVLQPPSTQSSDTRGHAASLPLPVHQPSPLAAH